MSKHNHKIGGHRPFFVVEQPYYLKHSPMNPFLGAVYDNVSVGQLKGYSLKPIHWLYRFRYNTAPRGSVPLGLQNPGGKNVHWLEVSNVKKFAIQIFSEECLPHTFLAACVASLVLWNFSRYIWSHPDLTLYNIAAPSWKPNTMQLRSNELLPMDKPVFRLFQRVSEFYAYDSYRDLIEMGVIANDPYIEYMKSIGREGDLTIQCPDLGWGEGGRGKIVALLPKTKIGETPSRDPLRRPSSGHDAHGHDSHGDGHDKH